MKKNDKKTRSAIALHYDEVNAPRVTAKGSGSLAEEIIKLAEEHGIPLKQDEELTRLLSDIPLDDEIPEVLYRAVAEVIAFAYVVTGRFPEGTKSGSAAN